MVMTMKKRIVDVQPTEAQEQKALFKWANWAKGKYPVLGLLYHIPNGGSRNIIEAHNLKMQGVKRGVPDICLPVPAHHYTGLYIELKRRNGGVVSREQREWLAALNRVGNKAVVCNGWEQARDVILEYLRQ